MTTQMMSIMKTKKNTQKVFTKRENTNQTVNTNQTANTNQKVNTNQTANTNQKVNTDHIYFINI